MNYLGDNNIDLRKSLLEFKEPEYQKFTQRLLPRTTKILGVRIPILRKFAKKLAGDYWKDYLAEGPEDYFEEIMIKGMVIGYAKKSCEEFINYTEWFLPKIQNWSVCDSFCSGLKDTKKYAKDMWEVIIACSKDNREFYARFSAVMILQYYTNQDDIEQALMVLNEINQEGYYAKMAVAWAISICFQKFPKITENYLKGSNLDNWTYNKALQKISESLKSDLETKHKVQEMKRKTDKFTKTSEKGEVL